MATQENKDILFPTNQQTIVDAPTETEEERKRREEIEARHEEVMDAVRNVQQDKSMLNTGNNGDTSYVQNNTFTGKDSASKPDIYIYPDITAPQKTAEEAQGWWNSYWAKQAQAEKEREMKRIEKQRFARSLGDLGAVIGDMIKAHNGGVVLPRDVQRQYDSLSAQQKQIIDNYWAKMEGLRKEQEAKDALAAQREYEAKKAQEQREHQQGLADQQIQAAKEAAEENRAFQAEEKEKDRANQRAIVRENNQTKKEIKNADMTYKQQRALEKSLSGIIEYQGQEFPISKEVADSRMANLYSYLKSNNLLSKDSGANDELSALVALYKGGGSMEPNTMNKVKAAALVSIYDVTDPKHIDEIKKILGGAEYVDSNANKPAGNAQEQNNIKIEGNVR